MRRILLLVFLLFTVCFFLTGLEIDFLQSRPRQKHNFHLVAPQGANVTIELYIDDLAVKNQGLVPYISEPPDYYEPFYQDDSGDFAAIGYVENALTFAELKDEYKQKLLRIEVTVILAYNKEEFTNDFEDSVIIEDLWDSDIYVDNNGEIEIMLSLG